MFPPPKWFIITAIAIVGLMCFFAMMTALLHP